MIIRLQRNNLKKPRRGILNRLTVYIPCSLNEIYNHYDLTSLARLQLTHFTTFSNEGETSNHLTFYTARRMTEKYSTKYTLRSSHLDYAVDLVTYSPTQLKSVQTCNSTDVDLLTTFVSKNSRRCESIDALIVLQSGPKHPYISQRI
jgi:hypothetical protein